MNDRRLVYTTDGTLPLPQPTRTRKPGRSIRPTMPEDGTIRVARERRRAGVVTIVYGLAAAELTEVGKTLKRTCGTGGTAKDGVLELQGDHRDRVAGFFETTGRRVKRVGG
jgi:CRP/FNR family transcriptional regulator, cyclic AMP receptor protein